MNKTPVSPNTARPKPSKKIHGIHTYGDNPNKTRKPPKKITK